jgi:hypothetical protein
MCSMASWAAPEAYAPLVETIRTTRMGPLKGFGGSARSGLAYLLVGEDIIPCDNESTAEALDRAFGSVLRPDRTMNQEAFIGQTVVYTTLSVGPNRLLVGFTPIADWTGPEVPPEGIEEPGGLDP